MNLTLYGDNLTLYGDILVLYPDGPGPVAEERLGGAWLPVIYLDREGNPVDLEAKVEAAVKAVPRAERKKAKEAASAVSEHLSDAKWIVANDMAREALVVLQYLEAIDAYIADLVRQDIARAAMEAEDQEAIAVLLLMH
ncbi:MAG: hypothetical protein ACRC6I_16615 [Paracoccaceae bacterium]